MADTVNVELARCVNLIKTSQAKLQLLGVTGASISGSVARGESTSESDVDVIVDIDPDVVTSIFDLTRIQGVLQSQLDRTVDILSRRSLTMPRHRELLRDAVRVF
jgi:predicted nucleotidyltransferase